MKSLFERATTTGLTLAALVIAALMVRREFAAARPNNATPEVGRPARIDDWSAVLTAGRRIGNESSAVTVAEFADLECQFCARFHETFSAVKPLFGDQLSLIFVHHPLPFHRFARPAARAAECAAKEGRFGSFVEAVFGRQDSLGLKTWSEFAATANIVDTATFSQCARDTTTLKRVEDGLALGRALGVRGTPTIVVNGWLFPVPPSSEQLESAVRAILAGKDPPY